jgi:hypothetical protein
MSELRRGHYDYLRDTIMNDPNISIYQSLLLIGILFVYFKRDMNNFRSDKWIHKSQMENVKEIIDNDTGHTLIVPD